MTLPTLFIPHGGGPCFFMDPNGGPPDPMWQPMQAYLAGLFGSLPERPRAILLVSGRTSFELVQKSLLAGIPLIAAVAIGVPVVMFLTFELWFLVALPKGPLEAAVGY